jgi:hypothetical protein
LTLAVIVAAVIMAKQGISPLLRERFLVASLLGIEREG